MLKKQNLIIPKADIKELEQARKYLHELIEINYPALMTRLVFNVTGKMYDLTHRKYKEI